MEKEKGKKKRKRKRNEKHQELSFIRMFSRNKLMLYYFMSLSIAENKDRKLMFYISTPHPSFDCKDFFKGIFLVLDFKKHV